LNFDDVSVKAHEVVEQDTDVEGEDEPQITQMDADSEEAVDEVTEVSEDKGEEVVEEIKEEAPLDTKDQTGQEIEDGE